MSIKPLHDRVVVKPIEADEVSAGGIVIPDSAKEKSTKGEVVAIGAGKPLDNGSLRAPVVKVGDKVIYGQYAGSSYKSEGVEYKVLREDDILAVIGRSGAMRWESGVGNRESVERPTPSPSHPAPISAFD